MTKLEDSPQITALKEAAKEACKNAYAPYSKFRVGAAVLMDNGKIFSGANVENVSFGLTICAERNAIFHAVASGFRNFKAIAIYTETDRPTTPCGACRQVINEFSPSVDIYCFNEDGEQTLYKINELLPEAFGPNNF